MEAFPPPDANDPMAAQAAAARADRIAALAARRAASAPTNTSPTRTAPAARPVRDRPAGRGKRRHAAQGARFAALGMSLASAGGLAALFAVTSPSGGAEVQAASIVVQPQSLPTTSQAVVVPPTAPSPPAVGTAAPTTSSSTTPTTAPSTTAAPPAAPVVVDGAVFHNRWGDVQVEATFGADGSLVDVITLRTPNDRSKSVQINDYAVPRLTAEALSAQSAQVDTVSGATYTSLDYRRSLQSAIDAATQAGIVVATA